MVLVVKGGSENHDGTYDTGMGVDIYDGTDTHEVRFMDDFFDIVSD